MCGLNATFAFIKLGIMKKLQAIIFTLLLLQFASISIAKDFEWGSATVYFVITDRFCNGDTTNDVNYGRIVDYGSEQINAATFHGGDFQGMLKKA